MLNYPIFNKPVTVVSARLLNEKVLSNSSSGGVFAGIAQNILNHGGFVCGAVLKGKEVEHKISSYDFKPFQGSKYIQSNMARIYLDIERTLKDKNIVLFSGTPCQVAGIHSFLRQRGIREKNLYTIDLVCHGVCSSELLNIYEDKLGKEIVSIISFRDKRNGWGPEYATTVELSDGTILRDENSCFTKGFSGFKLLRKSCYDCIFRRLDRCADLTVGDLWGVKNKLKNENGISLVLVNTTKGENLLKDSSELFEISSLANESFWLYGNPNLVKHSNPYRYHPFRLLLNWNMRNLSPKMIRALYCQEFEDGIFIKRFVRLVDSPYDFALRHERKRKCKEVLSDFFD